MLIPKKDPIFVRDTIRFLRSITQRTLVVQNTKLAIYNTPAIFYSGALIAAPSHRRRSRRLGTESGQVYKKSRPMAPRTAPTSTFAVAGLAAAPVKGRTELLGLGLVLLEAPVPLG